MQFRTSITSVQVTLLTAMGFGSLAACGGTAVDHSAPASDAGANGGVAPSAGGAANAGTSSGGVQVGGRPNGGAAAAGGSAGMPCDSPVRIVSPQTGMGPSGGFVRCADGTTRRTSVDECWSNID